MSSKIGKILKEIGFRKNSGLSNIPLIIVLLLMAIAIPVVTMYVQQQQDIRNRAATHECPNPITCNGQSCCGTCEKAGENYEYCVSGPTPIPTTKTCTDDINCPNNQICVGGICENSHPGYGCVRDTQCPVGYHCPSGTCVRIGACTDDINCPNNQICVGGTCENSHPGYDCIRNTQCPVGYSCISGKCSKTGGCTDDLQCPNYQICNFGVCENSHPGYDCIRDTQCPEGCGCTGGKCVCPTPTDVCTRGVCECVGTGAVRCCKSDGTGWLSADCGEGTTCSGGICNGPSPTNTPSPTPTTGGGGGPTSGVSPTPVRPCDCRNNPAAKPIGDANCDGLPTIEDASIWRSEFADQKGPTTSSSAWKADFNCDGYVDMKDINDVWLPNYKDKLIPAMRCSSPDGGQGERSCFNNSRTRKTCINGVWTNDYDCGADYMVCEEGGSCRSRYCIREQNCPEGYFCDLGAGLRCRPKSL